MAVLLPQLLLTLDSHRIAFGIKLDVRHIRTFLTGLGW